MPESVLVPFVTKAWRASLAKQSRNRISCAW